MTAPQLPTDTSDLSALPAVLERVVEHVAQGVALEWYPPYTAERLQALDCEVSNRWLGPQRRLQSPDDSHLKALHWALLDMLHAALARTEPPWPDALLALASACFGRQHLWQDLGLDGRAQVSLLLRQGFPTLHASNVRDLKWKRHLFLVLGMQRGEVDLRPPKCDGCDHFAQCFPTT